MKVIKKLFILSCSVLLTGMVQAQTTHPISVGSNGFMPDTVYVDVDDLVQFTLNLNTANGAHYTKTTSVPNSGTTWDHLLTCASCIYEEVINVAGTYLHYDSNSGETGVIIAGGQVGLEENELRGRIVTINPNPATESPNVHYVLKGSSGLLRVTDMNGKIIQEIDLERSQGAVRLNKLNASGLYTCTLLDEQGIVGVQKVIISK